MIAWRIAGLGLLLLTSGCFGHGRGAQSREHTREQLEQKGVRFLDDHAAGAYLAGVVERLASRTEHPGVEWKTALIDEPSLVNAFAAPEGSLYVCTGLLLQAENEAELAGVLAHEMQHVLGHDAARERVKRDDLNKATLALAFVGLLPMLASQALGEAVLLAYSRNDELEADAFAARATSKVGYDPRALVSFIRRIQGAQPDAEALNWLSTHPTSNERISRLEALITERKLSGEDAGTDRLAAVKALLHPSGP